MTCFTCLLKQDPTTAGKELKRLDFQGEGKYDKYVTSRKITSRR
jgi:hypothetical protein